MKKRNDLVIVAHPGDELLEFSSLLPAKIWVASQLSLDAQTVSSNDRIWTHSPADRNAEHREVARQVSELFGNSDVHYSHGTPAHEYQQVADVCHALTSKQLQIKMDGVNRLHPSPSCLCDSASILSVEKFVRLTPAQVRHLQSLQCGPAPDAASTEDLWGFFNSQHEQERFLKTLAWVQRWALPQRDRIVEVGACEGAFTQHLISAGYRDLVVCEPNPRFRQRLFKRLGNFSGEVDFSDVAALTKRPTRANEVFLLAEMLYYFDNLDVLARLPTDRLLITIADDYARGPFAQWCSRQEDWRIEENEIIVGPHVEYLVGEKVYRRKAATRGLILKRVGRRPTMGLSRWLEWGLKFAAARVAG